MSKSTKAAPSILLAAATVSTRQLLPPSKLRLHQNQQIQRSPARKPIHVPLHLRCFSRSIPQRSHSARSCSSARLSVSLTRSQHLRGSAQQLVSPSLAQRGRKFQGFLAQPISAQEGSPSSVKPNSHLFSPHDFSSNQSSEAQLKSMDPASSVHVPVDDAKKLEFSHHRDVPISAFNQDPDEEPEEEESEEENPNVEPDEEEDFGEKDDHEEDPEYDSDED